MWVLLGIFSSVFLGFHEIFKKAALNHNAVLPVLLIGSIASAGIFLPFIVISRIIPEVAAGLPVYIPPAGEKPI